MFSPAPFNLAKEETIKITLGIIRHGFCSSPLGRRLRLMGCVCGVRGDEITISEREARANSLSQAAGRPIVQSSPAHLKKIYPGLSQLRFALRRNSLLFPGSTWSARILVGSILESTEGDLRNVISVRPTVVVV